MKKKVLMKEDNLLESCSKFKLSSKSTLAKNYVMHTHGRFTLAYNGITELHHSGCVSISYKVLANILEPYFNYYILYTINRFC
jgi:hypothetical protein